MRKNMCCRCEEHRAGRRDPNYCEKCYDAIERMVNNRMNVVRATRCYFDHTIADEARNVYAFLSIFHPEMAESRKRKIVADVKEKNKQFV